MVQSEKQLARWVSTAALWSYAGVFLDRIIRFLVFLVVARLISPPQFGLVLLSLLVVDLLQSFLETGLSGALIQQPALSKTVLDTAFLITIGISLVTTVVLLCSTQYLAVVSSDAAFVPFLRALALIPLLNGAGAIHVAIM